MSDTAWLKQALFFGNEKKNRAKFFTDYNFSHRCNFSIHRSNSNMKISRFLYHFACFYFASLLLCCCQDSRTLFKFSIPYKHFIEFIFHTAEHRFHAVNVTVKQTFPKRKANSFFPSGYQECEKKLSLSHVDTQNNSMKYQHNSFPSEM